MLQIQQFSWEFIWSSIRILLLVFTVFLFVLYCVLGCLVLVVGGGDGIDVGGFVVCVGDVGVFMLPSFMGMLVALVVLLLEFSFVFLPILFGVLGLFMLMLLIAVVV